jgi:cytochrome c oxidase cbb3-type subunit III
MNRRTVNLVFMTFVAVAAAGCTHLPGRPGPGPEVMRPENIVDFDVLYGQNCSACHGSGGKGGAAVSLADPTYLSIIDDATLRTITANGIPGSTMPGFARSAGGMLTDHQVDVLVQQMRARWARPGALGGTVPPPYKADLPGDAQRGAGVYKTFCFSCHGPDGKGGAKAGSIVDAAYLSLVTDQALRTAVIVARPDSGAPDWRNDLPGRPMTDQEVTDVVAWLAAQRPPNPDAPNAPGQVATAQGKE